jgi:two-component system nitrogen regulation response regulator NtrX
LRRRKEDIPVLAEHFLRVYCDMYGLKTKTLDKAVIEKLTDYQWPGNVRELRNIIERMVITSQAEYLSVADLPPLTEASLLRTPGYADVETYEEFKSVSEKRFLESRLAEFGWNIALTARNLGMQRSNLYKKMQKLGIKPKQRD